MSEVGRLRKEIEGIDRELIRLLARRFEQVRRLGPCKEREGVSIEDPARERELDRLHGQLARQLGLSEELVARIFQAVLAESKRQQAEAAAAERS